MRNDRSFDAYFSTRAEGMGMGLAISRTIVESLQGRIRMESEPGLGRHFVSPDRQPVTLMQESTVYIVDDDPDMRDCLRWLLKTVGLRSVCYPSAADFLREFRAEEGPACLLLDVRMPGTSGLDLFEELAARGVAPPVLFVTAYADVPMAVRALKSGAAEFIEKPFNAQALLEKVQAALRDDAERRAREAAAAGVRAKLARLTGKEREVLVMIREGRSNKEIAARLDLTPRAVELRRASLMRKLEVQSLADLLRLTFGHDADPLSRPGPVDSPAR